MHALLRFYDRLAARLFPFRAVFWVLAASALCGFGATLFLAPSATDTAWMFLALLVFLWALCVLLLVHAFIHQPPPAATGDPLRLRLWAWCARAGRVLLAVLMTLLCVAVALLSLRVVGVFSRVLDS